MRAIDIVAKDVTRSFEMLKNHLADFSDADLLVRPVPGANHVNWQIGHLVGVEAKTCELVGVAGPKLPEGFRDRYKKDAASSDDPANFVTKDELLAFMAQTSEAIAKWVASLSDADLAKPTPPPFNSFCPTLGDLAVLTASHRTMHLGQVQVIRRKLGKKVLF